MPVKGGDAKTKSGPEQRKTLNEALVTLAFSVSLLLGATLLFSIQPLFTQIVLPMLGGSPVVWNTAILFFQSVLLAGYLYAHFLNRYLKLGRQLAVHGTLLLVAVGFLPIAVAAGWEPPVNTTPVGWLVGLLAVSIGLPVFATAATAPLLQSWYSRTGHGDAHDPYFLYGASNLGSLVALLGYPVIVAPLIGLEEQAFVWSAGYLGLALAILVCGFLTIRRGAKATALPKSTPLSSVLVSAIRWPVRLKWLILAFVPSSVLLGATLHISTDIAATPFLWVVPLAIYLLTYILVFSKTRILPHRFMVEVEAVVIIVLSLYFSKELVGGEFLIHLLVLFAIAMVCHGELARLRPVASHLTEFYFWLSLGGVLGGVFNVLIAPVIFDAVLEYPLIIAAACLVRPVLRNRKRLVELSDLLLPAVFALGIGSFYAAGYSTGGFGALTEIAIFIIVGTALYSFSYRPVGFSIGVAVVLFAPLTWGEGASILARERSFFGVYEVVARNSGTIHTLMHGTTLHGSQFTDEDRATIPLSYYSRLGPLGDVFRAFNNPPGEKSIAAVGLGVGTIACYGRPEQTMTFMEIDPAVESLARNPIYFNYLKVCGKGITVELGDARRTIAQTENDSFDLIVLDAFSSDAIPIHLLTREAFGLYFRKLKPGGMLAVHISNKFLDLRPVLSRLVEDTGWSALVRFHSRKEIDAEYAEELAVEILPSIWVVVAENSENFGDLQRRPTWRELETDEPGRVWTDDYADVFGALKWLK